MNANCFFGILFFLIFIFTPSCFAVGSTIVQSPSSITSDPFTITVSVLGASPGQNYLRVDLYKEGSTNYFGETFNGADWYKDSEGTHYFPIIIIDPGTPVTATIQSRIGQPSNGEFPGPGEYRIRIRRYTASGNLGSDTGLPVSAQIVYSFPTLTPTPTEVSVPSRTPTPTKVPTSQPLPAATKTPTPWPTQVKDFIQDEDTSFDNAPTSILGTSDVVLTPTPMPTRALANIKTDLLKQGPNYVAIILCSLGGILLITCGILVYLNKKKGLWI